MSTKPAPPIIDVIAYEKLPEAALVPRSTTAAAPPDDPPSELPPPPPFDPLQVLHAQRRLLHDQHQALRDMILELETPRLASVPANTPYADLITRSMAALDRSLGTIMHSLEHTFGTDRRNHGSDP